MRIAYLCMDPGIPVFGKKGCSVHVQEVIRAFVRQGAQVELFALRQGGACPSGLENVRLHKLPSLPKDDPAAREQVAIAANKTLIEKLKTSGRFDMIYERYSLWSFAGMDYAAENKIPGILEINAPLIEEQAKHRSLIDRPSAEAIASQVFHKASALVCVSAEVARYIIEREGAAIAPKVHVIPNGIDPQRYSGLAASDHCHDKAFVIGFVGTLKPWHGLQHLLRAFSGFYREYPKALLRIVGDGPQREEILALAEQQGIRQAIHMVGAVEPEQVPSWLASMDVAVAPYPDMADFYFSPLKVYEYMAAGLPVIASRIGQLEQLIQNGVNGVHTEPGDAESIRHALQRLYNDSTLRHSMGQKAQQTVLQNHSWDKVSEQILQIASNSIANTAEAV